MYIFNQGSDIASILCLGANSLSEYHWSTSNTAAGYINLTKDVTGVRFHVVSSGTLSGTFLLWIKG